MFGRKNLPADVTAQLHDLAPGARVLAWASGPNEALVVALDSALAIRRSGEWQVIGWHLMQGGGWNRDTSALKWTTNDDTRGSITLDEPGRVPEVFNERVMASIVVQQNYEAPDGGRVMVAGRRVLGKRDGRQAVVWQAVTQGKAKLSDPVVQQFVLEKTAELAEQNDL